MPLTPGAPISDTIKELVHHGSRPRPMKQIIAIAEANHRRKRDAGGGIQSEPIHLGGLVAGTGGGRSDTVMCSVPRGAYILPADVVAGLGQGNPLRGAKLLDRVFKTPALVVHPMSPRLPMVPVKLSSAEYVIHPAAVAKEGEGNLDRGHDLLDRWVEKTRAAHVKETKALPGPKGSNEK